MGVLERSPFDRALNTIRQQTFAVWRDLLQYLSNESEEKEKQ